MPPGASEAGAPRPGGPGGVRGRFTARLLARRPLAAGTFELELTRPAEFTFVPGQHLRLEHPEFSRDYSPVSRCDDPTLALCVRRVTGGQGSNWLLDLEIGARVTFTGPHGYFTWRGTDRPAVWIATGTGIAPFVAMARAGARARTLLHGARSAAELHYRDTLEKAVGRYVPCLSGLDRAEASGGAAWPGGRAARGAAATSDPDRALVPPFPGRVTEYAATRLEPGCYDFYLCGRSDMIRELVALIDARFVSSLVFSEAFF